MVGIQREVGTRSFKLTEWGVVWVFSWGHPLEASEETAEVAKEGSERIRQLTWRGTRRRSGAVGMQG